MGYDQRWSMIDFQNMGATPPMTEMLLQVVGGRGDVEVGQSVG